MDVQQMTYSEPEYQPRVGRSVSIEHAAQLLAVSRRTVYYPHPGRPAPHHSHPRRFAARADGFRRRHARVALSALSTCSPLHLTRSPRPWSP
jgi:hypothetical protein